MQRALIIAFLLLNGQLAADCAHSLAPSHAALPVASYQLKDLGSTTLKQSQLTRLEPLYSLAPSINNRGQILFNNQEGAYLRDPNVGEYALSPSAPLVYGHAINDKGNALVSLVRKGSPTEWMLWSLQSTPKCGRPQAAKIHIAQLDKDTPLFLGAMNDDDHVIGYKEVNDKLHPLIWTPCTSLQPLGQAGSYDIEGFPRSINNQGTVVGFFEDRTDSPPFMWSCHDQLQVLYDYRNLIMNLGWVELTDMVVNNKNVVYGTFLLKYVAQNGNQDNINNYFTYRWSPADDTFSFMGLKDMRIAAINNNNSIVGSLKGHAIVRHEGQDPVDLNTLIDNQNGDWELLEATSINDSKIIVGYGTFKGTMHLFLLEPLLRHATFKEN